MEDEAYLIKESYVSEDSEGNVIRRREATYILCDIRAVSRAEYYQAATQDLKPELTMTISHSIDYDGQKLVYYQNTLYDVTRTYWSGNEVELILTKRNGTLERRGAVLIMPDGSEVIFADDRRLTIDY